MISRTARPTTKTLWETLVTKNPMTVEIGRAARRYLTFSNSNGTVTFGLLLGIILYAILVLTVVNLRGEFPPKIVLWIHLLVTMVVAPMTLHASIAGERERRSWDMLMVAPVTQAQVVVGKLLGGLAVQAAIAAAMLLPTMVAAVSYSNNGDALSLYGLLRLELVVLTTGIFCAGLTMLISARVKRGFVALGVSFSVLLLLFAFFPVILGIATGGSGWFGELIMAWHPAMALNGIDEPARSYGYMDSGGFHRSAISGWTQIVFNTVFAAIFIAWTVKTVAFADNEVRFLPGKKKDLSA